MGCVAVEDLSQGMVLSEDVRDIHCRLLLSRGQVISEKHLRILKIWGVCAVNVVGSPKGAEDASETLDPERMARTQAITDRVFRHLDTGHETIQGIYQEALAYRYAHPGAAFPGERWSAAGHKGATVDADSIRTRISTVDLKLPDAPPIISELNAVIADPFATSNDVARVVNKSPALAALLLRIVNSAYYGFPSKIDRITRAVTIIGTKEISSLALGICVMRTFKDIPAELIDMAAFIRHSLACGLLARMIAAQKNLPETEQLSVAGLLHDMGKLIIFKYYPGPAAAAHAHAAAAGCTVYQSERSLFGIDHTQVAKHLLQKWKIPPVLANSIIHHHHPSAAQDVTKAVIVQMADIIANGLGLGTSGELAIPAFDDKAWDGLGIAACNINWVIRQAIHQLGALDITLV